MRVKRFVLLLVIVVLVSSILPASAQQSTEVRRFPIPGMLASAKLSPDGRTLAVFENGNIYDAFQVPAVLFPIRLIDIETGEQRTLEGQTDVAADVAFSPDGTRLVSYHGGGSISVWDLTSGEELKRFPTLPGMGRLLFLPDGQTVAVTTRNLPFSIQLLNIETGAVTQVLNRHYETYADYEAFVTGGSGMGPRNDNMASWTTMPDGSGFVIATFNDAIEIWKLPNSEPKTLVFSTQENPMIDLQRLTITSDGKTLIYFNHLEDILHFVDITSEEEITSFEVNTKLDPAVSADGQRIVWVDQDTGELIVWDADQPDSPVTVTLPDPEMAISALKAQAGLGGVMLTPDGKTAILAGFFSNDGPGSEVWAVPLPE